MWERAIVVVASCALLAQDAGAQNPPLPVPAVGPESANPGRKQGNLLGNNKDTTVIPVDNSGFGSWRYLNPRRPVQIAPGTAVAVHNRTDRSIVVTRVALSVPSAMASDLFDPAAQPKVDPNLCRPTALGLECGTGEITIGPGLIEPVLDESTLALFSRVSNLIANRNIVKAKRSFPTIRLRLRFRDEASEPSNAIAYLTFADPGSAILEPPNETTLAMGASVTGTVGPRTSDEKSPLTTTSPFDGDIREPASGDGSLTVRQTLGSRAEGRVQLTFKDGPLGQQTAERLVSASEYAINIFDANAVISTFGKQIWAAPSDAIATRLTGEGVAESFRSVRASYVLDKVRDGTTVKRDSAVWMIDGRQIPLTNTSFPRTISLMGLFGNERAGQAHFYWTGGGDLFFALPQFALHGSLGYYYSRAWAKDGSAFPDSHGDVGLLSATFTQRATDSTVQRSWRLRAGRGSGDDPSTPTFEGYVGETAAFAPDRLFLSSLAGRIDTEGRGQVGKGLANKWYAAVAWREQRTKWINPLTWIPTWFHLEEMSSQATTLTGHLYRLREPVLDHRGSALEADLDFEAEIPKGVKTTLSFSYFDPGRAFDDFFDRDVWQILLKLQVAIQ